MKVAFHANQLCLRGTTTSLFNYAKFNEEVLGNESLILVHPNRDLASLKRFEDRFNVIISYPDEYTEICKKNKVERFYHIHGGWLHDGIRVNDVKTLYHLVFGIYEPHGDVYVYVSDWLAKNQGFNPETHSLPHIVTKFEDSSYDIRKILGIKKNDLVFGCLGGGEEFNIPFVQEAVINTAKKRKDIFFIFLNISPFGENLKNVIFLPGTYDMNYKASFIRACDSMLHARSRGETFGCAVSEFSIENKPVVTYYNSPEKSHIELLGEKGIYYHNYEEIFDIINNFKNYIKFDNYFECYESCSPENVMKRFKKIFLD